MISMSEGEILIATSQHIPRVCAIKSSAVKTAYSSSFSHEVAVKHKIETLPSWDSTLITQPFFLMQV